MAEQRTQQAKQPDPGALKVFHRPDDKRTESQMLAELALQPHVGNAFTVRNYCGLSDRVDVTDLAEQMKAATAEAVSGDTKRLEGMLAAQSLALDTIFQNLCHRAVKTSNIAHLEAYMRMALRAQNQARHTVETLSLVKNPRQLSFIKQQNVAQGHQQVNNYAEPARAGEAPTAPNELLEAYDAVTLDTRAPSASGRADPQLAPVGALNRPNQR